MERGDADFARFSQAWGELVSAVARARSRGAAAAEVELTFAQALLLEIVAGLEEPTVGEVAHAAGIASPSATRMLQQLERKGMVVRRHPERDERVTVVTMTKAGGRALAEHRQRVGERLRELFAGVEPGLRPLLVELLHDMRDAVNEM
ncbi:MarR family winged helix-turn-helix transcriptional regulator [Actinorugispora endophytica]|uniref:DNA-binding MarR family transcriptional regulator n=1 Tax=Actinorugispora endophytica TaxID=1605990 RepID=A0A4R6URS7_9ACTN|nr:MarR family transcriptional regulator [Actinorugispora endophytica]TDQ49980.1 DNA-binding MarR family transcriptional regulator [Actinorugispora endophytica]